jgi:ribonucleotide monophosphatase NagD (HAD superfamily)
MPRIVSDIDGTVLEQGEPLQPVIDWIKANSEEVVFLTNRPEAERERTVADLERVGIAYQELILNDTGEEAPVFKAKVVAEMLRKGEKVDYFIDDSEANLDAVEALGVDVVDPEDIEGMDGSKDDESEPEDAGMAEATFSRPPIGDSTMDLSNLATPEAKLKAALEASASAVAERDTLRADIEALTAKNLELSGSAEAKVAEVQGKLDAAVAEKAAALEQIAALTAKVAELEASAKTVAKAAAEKVAAIGLKEPLAVTNATPAGKDAGSILEQYAAITDASERLAFFNANKRAIFAARQAVA